MKKGQKRSIHGGIKKKSGRAKLPTAPATRPLKAMLSQATLLQSLAPQKPQPTKNQSSFPSTSFRFQKLIDSDSSQNGSQPFPHNSSSTLKAEMDLEAGGAVSEKDLILSQDFFCTPDYITPECHNIFDFVDGNKEIDNCPESPEKIKTTKSKIFKRESIFVKSPDSTLSDQQQIVELSKDTSYLDEAKLEKVESHGQERGQSYVSRTAVALRCRVMPPPCIKNPYMKYASDMGVDPFDNWRSKCSGLSCSLLSAACIRIIFPSLFTLLHRRYDSGINLIKCKHADLGMMVFALGFMAASSGADNLSRYRSDFQEIEQIGHGNFSHVFKVLNRIDGCMYAVKHSIRQLHLDSDRRKALMEVQALAALGFHENITGYYTAWFENQKLYIQMELCDYSLSSYQNSTTFTEEEAIKVVYQIAKALQAVHERGMAHLDVKPDNIYVKNGIYKLGDFGCATLLDRNLPVEEGDARYMPREILNERYDHLDKVDIYSLGVSVYELIRGSSVSNPSFHVLNAMEGKLPHVPTYSIQLQDLLKAMVNPDPTHRPSAKDIVEHPMFNRTLKDGEPSE